MTQHMTATEVGYTDYALRTVFLERQSTPFRAFVDVAIPPKSKVLELSNEGVQDPAVHRQRQCTASSSEGQLSITN